MYDAQKLDPSLWAQNVITISNTNSGDSVGCRSVAFKKLPNNVYAKEGGMNEWEFNAGAIDTLFGTY
jgi:hypothetical protein